MNKPSNTAALGSPDNRERRVQADPRPRDQRERPVKGEGPEGLEAAGDPPPGQRRAEAEREQGSVGCRRRRREAWG